ncbi:unnamed protein product [Nippostrongylus brasiliensis]|uniref:Acylamino-acid-releasing enzyme (inferred by orthology to a human protein) n=1 Tax=Nippostrongylus brasiliensis TaxID=27835 RepID=A0A0N4YL29_NIPBR|nr:unnamed protein product [Nippostrongylus brasiliensis]
MSSTTAAEQNIRALERIKDIYGDLAQVPTLSTGRIQRSGKIIQISSVWDNHALSLNKNTKTQRSSVLEKVNDAGELRLISTTSLPLTNYDSQTVAYSPSNSLVAQLITIPDGKDKKQYLKVFDQNEHLEVLCSDLTSQKKHGLIYGVGSAPFGTLKFSHGEGHVLYCAERNFKTAQFFDADLEWENDEKMIESKVGKKFELHESWGESCADVKRPLLCIVDISSGNVTALDQVPQGISPSFAIWAPDDAGIVFFGLSDEPFRLGKIACNNRPGTMYYYELSSATLHTIGRSNIAAEHPTFSPDGKTLVYFQRYLVKVKVPWPYDGSTPSVVIPIVDEVQRACEFPGFSFIQKSQRCWTADGNRLVVGTAWRSKMAIWAPDDAGIVFFGLSDEPFRLGKIACNNRPGTMYYYELSSATLHTIGRSNIAAEHPTFSPDGKTLVYFQREADGPHQATMECVKVPAGYGVAFSVLNRFSKCRCQQFLKKIMSKSHTQTRAASLLAPVNYSKGEPGYPVKIKVPWPYDGSTPSVVIPIVDEVQRACEFPGFSFIQKSQRCWTADGNRLVVGTAWRSKMELVAIDISSDDVVRLTNHSQCHGTWQVVDVCDDEVLAVVSAPNRPPALLLGTMPAKGDEDKIVWTRLDNCSVIENRKNLLNYSWRLVGFNREGETPYEGVLMMPNDGDELPLVVVPHGGPHGVSIAG